MKTLQAVFLGSLIFAGQAAAQVPLDVAGIWTCSGGCNCLGTTIRDASIVQSGENGYLLLRNECGDVSLGSIKEQIIEAQKWKAVGTVSSDLKQIAWPNGKIWTRHETTP